MPTQSIVPARRRNRGLATVVIALLCLGGAPFTRAADVPVAEVPHIEVRGEAMVRTAPDLVELTVTVVSQERDAQRALNTNTSRVDAIRKALNGIGLSNDELRTGQFQLQPQWSQPPQNPGPQWRPVIVGFVIEHQVLVRTKKLTLAGRILSTASDAGANQIGELRFSLADPAPQRAEAIRQATRNAIADARNIAGAAGVTVGPMLAITLDADVPAPQPYPRARTMSMVAVGAESTPVSIEPGAIDTHAAVLLRVAIAR